MTKALALLMLTFLPSANLNSPPMSGQRERGSAIARDKDGHERWKNDWTMERTTLDGKAVLRFTEEGHGKRSPFDQEVRWTITSLWTDDNPPRPIRSDSTTSDSTGHALATELRVFDFTRKQVEVTTTDSENSKAKRETQKISTDTLAVDGLAGVLRGLDFGSKVPFSAHLLTNESKVYDVTFESRGREKLTTEDGTVECYKIEVVPHLGLLNVFRFMYPKTYFWFEVDSPHTWVRYVGSENGPGSPEVILQRSHPPAR